MSTHSIQWNLGSRRLSTQPAPDGGARGLGAAGAHAARPPHLRGEPVDGARVPGLRQERLLAFQPGCYE